MRTVTADHASHHLAGLLDEVAHGESFSITRAGRVVAEIRPTTAGSTAGALRQALAGLSPLDGDLEADIAAATALLTQGPRQWHGA